MQTVLTLAAPFFGLILLGYIAGYLKKLPESGLSWMNFFIVYVALPALFFRLLSQTPVEQLSNITYISATTLVTYTMFALSFCIGLLATRGNMSEATILGIAGSYSNVGYMGPGLTLAVLGPMATVPTALILCFDNALMFILAPLMMAIAGNQSENWWHTTLTIFKRIFTHPFIVSTILGVLVALSGFETPEALDRLLAMLSGSAAPCALFVMGVNLALRPVGRITGELPTVLVVKLLIHPILIFFVLQWIGGFDPVWIAVAMLMAALPPATNVFVIAQQYTTYVQRAAAFVMMGTVLSLVTVTSFIWYITQVYLP
ncbi:MAG: AEC family transporter [Rhodobacteraceae bacterium]|nr:AEC family transporter [Paracoccaceae bacterium]